jgi:hypothetical protein
MPSGQDFFSLEELLFIAMVLAILATLGGVGIATLMREPEQRGRAWPVLRWLGVAVGLYLVVVLAFSLKPPAVPVAHKGDPQCLAHRCVTVDEVKRMVKGTDTVYTLTLRLTNSGRFPFKDQVEGLYLVDTGGRHYAPAAADTGSLNEELGPFQTVMVPRVFTLPREARVAGFLVDRGRDGPPIGCLVIGGNCWYDAPKAVVPIE